MSDVDAFFAATGSEETAMNGPMARGGGAPDAAATPDAAGDTPEGMPDFGFLFSGQEPPAHDAAPDTGDADEPDPLSAEEDDPYAAESDDDADADEPETLEERVARLEAEKAAYEQAQREEEAERNATATREFWQKGHTEVFSRKDQALAWLEQEARNRGYDGLDWALTQLPRIVDSFAAELVEFKDAQIRATWDVARRHAAQTYVQKLAGDFNLSEADVAEIAQFSPEEMDKAARLIARVRGSEVAPVKQQLKTTKGQLTKAQRANSRAHKAQMPTPPSGGTSTVIDFAKAKQAITPDNADAIAGRLFEAMGIFG